MKTILVIDDTAIIRQLLREFLEMEGYNVLTAETAELGFPKVMQADLVLSDVNTGGLYDGNELCRKIKVDYPNLPVILMSSLSIFTSQADFTFTKGHDLGELVGKVNELLTE